jgi:thiamine pyrophosphate-dependent acetolactate synthase large subunit-like protein
MNEIERPLAGNDKRPGWGSDLIAEVLRRCDVPYVAMVPGSSYRGLQDSLVNYLGNRLPQMLVCLHEEHAVAIAHGYAKVTGRAMAAALHSNVGLMHAAMAIYNAYCDRAPVLVLGATGPVDASQRRPWIDWIHTSRDQGALVRGYVKWDEQPASPKAGVEATLRAWQIIHAHPRGPAYICYDLSDQEAAVGADFALPEVSRFTTVPEPVAGDAEIAAAADALRRAKSPVILAGRSSRSGESWNARIALAEHLGAPVITDMKVAAAFPTRHKLHVPGAAQFLSDQQKRMLAGADVVLALDWMDVMGALRQALPEPAELPVVISATLDDGMLNGWSYDHYALPPVDHRLPCTADRAVAQLCQALGVDVSMAPRATATQGPADLPKGDALGLRELASGVRLAFEGRKPSYLRFPLGWPADETPFDDPQSYFGADGGAGIGSGPGMAVGSALALAGSGRLPVAILGDGDFIMGASAIWTAAHYRIPLLIVVANNRSYFNDEIHQETMAVHRSRPVANRWIGQRLDDPLIDVPAMARSLGAVSPASVTRPQDLAAALETALSAVEAGSVYVLDVQVRPGYLS